MRIKAKFVHTNLIARDWASLAGFYAKIFGCTRVPPERHYTGRDLDRGTGIAGARLDGVHLRLPGWGENGPTLEIYTYSPQSNTKSIVVNQAGFGHIAFSVDDVAQAQAEVLAAGGTAIGEIVTLEPAKGRRVTWCYVADPEGNIIELQSWNPER